MDLQRLGISIKRLLVAIALLAWPLGEQAKTFRGSRSSRPRLPSLVASRPGRTTACASRGAHAARPASREHDQDKRGASRVVVHARAVSSRLGEARAGLHSLFSHIEGCHFESQGSHCRTSPAAQPDVTVATRLVSAGANWLTPMEMPQSGISAELQNTGITGGGREVASDAIVPRALPLIRAAGAQRPCTGATNVAQGVRRPRPSVCVVPSLVE